MHILQLRFAAYEMCECDSHVQRLIALLPSVCEINWAELGLHARLAFGGGGHEWTGNIFNIWNKLTPDVRRLEPLCSELNFVGS